MTANERAKITSAVLKLRDHLARVRLSRIRATAIYEQINIIEGELLKRR